MVAPCFPGLLGCRRPFSVRPSLLAMGHPCPRLRHGGRATYERPVFLPLRCSHFVTNRRRGGGELVTDFSAACAPASPVAYVLVLGLPSGSTTPCGVSVGKGGVFGWARLARATTLSSFRPCGTCPPLLRKPSASLVHPCLATMSQVSVPREPT